MREAKAKDRRSVLYGVYGFTDMHVGGRAESLIKWVRIGRITFGVYYRGYVLQVVVLNTCVQISDRYVPGRIGPHVYRR
jgi:hypothetical protein